MSKIAKGDRVELTGENAGVTGTVFWVGKSRYGPGLRFGVTGDDDEKYWAGEDEIVPEGGATPEGETGGTEAKAEAKTGGAEAEANAPPARKSTFDGMKALRALERHIKNYDDKKTRKELEGVPRAERAAFLVKNLGALYDSDPVMHALAASLQGGPIEPVVRALRILTKKSWGAPMPSADAERR